MLDITYKGNVMRRKSKVFSLRNSTEVSGRHQDDDNANWLRNNLNEITHAYPLSMIFCTKSQISGLYSLTLVSTSAGRTCNKDTIKYTNKISLNNQFITAWNRDLKFLVSSENMK